MVKENKSGRISSASYWLGGCRKLKHFTLTKFFITCSLQPPHIPLVFNDLQTPSWHVPPVALLKQQPVTSDKMLAKFQGQSLVNRIGPHARQSHWRCESSASSRTRTRAAFKAGKNTRAPQSGYAELGAGLRAPRPVTYHFGKAVLGASALLLQSDDSHDTTW